MSEQQGRRFALDKIVVDPAIKNRILSAEDDDHVGDWDGENINDLVKELGSAGTIAVVVISGVLTRLSIELRRVGA